MKHFLSLAIAIFFFTVSKAQYYYNDIVATEQVNANYKLLRNNKIRKVKTISTDANNQVIEGFSVEQELSSNGHKMVTSTTTTDGPSSEMITYYENDRIVKTEQKANNLSATVEYAYDATGKLLKVTTNSADTIIKNVTKDEHIWLYNAKGQPEQMLKVENGKDTIKVVLVYENDLPAAEQWRKGNIKIETYYYYFDGAKRVTDVVHYNQSNGKMEPENLFQYDTEGRLARMVQPIRKGGNQYLVWKYTYNDKGLKATEAAFDKSRKPLGTMEYTYN